MGKYRNLGWSYVCKKHLAHEKKRILKDSGKKLPYCEVPDEVVLKG